MGFRIRSHVRKKSQITNFPLFLIIMRKVVITEELIASYPYKSSRWTPHQPWCKICSVDKGPPRTHTFRVLKVGEEAIEVTFRNGTVAYYHIGCWNHPNNKDKVRAIKKQEHVHR